MALYSRPRNTRLLVVSLVMASLITITIDFRGGQNGPFEVAGRGALSVVGALQGAVSRVVHPIGSMFTGIAHIASLRSENDALKKQIAQYRAEVGKNVSNERIIQELTKLLKLQENLQLRHTVAARVTGESPTNFEWAVFIDKGSSDDVKVDQPVVSGDGLVGHVISVAPHASKVLLIIDPDSAVAARLTSSGETGLVNGQRNRPLIMDLVNPDVKVFPNEEVVTSGFQGGLYPPDIPIGFVSHVYSARGSLTKTIEMAPAVDFSALEFVLVITKA